MAEITTQALEELMPLVAHRDFSYVLGRGLRDKDGFCPVCALVDEIVGWQGDKTDAWWAARCLLDRRTGFNMLPSDVYIAVTNIVTAADEDQTMPRAQRLRALLEVKS